MSFCRIHECNQLGPHVSYNKREELQYAKASGNMDRFDFVMQKNSCHQCGSATHKFMTCPEVNSPVLQSFLLCPLSLLLSSAISCRELTRLTRVCHFECACAVSLAASIFAMTLQARAVTAFSCVGGFSTCNDFPHCARVTF